MKIFAYLSLGAVISLSACQNNNANKSTTDTADTVALVDDGHTSENSLDWNGVYEGVIPCADCPGIQQTITLNTDNTFSLHTVYLERDVESKDSGNFVWEKNGSEIAINTAENQLKFKVREGSLLLLDTEGNEITGALADSYVLNKK